MTDNTIGVGIGTSFVYPDVVPMLAFVNFEGGGVVAFDNHGLGRLVDGLILSGQGAVRLQQGAVHPLSYAALRVDQQADHITTAAGMSTDRTAVPVYNGGSGQG